MSYIIYNARDDNFINGDSKGFRPELRCGAFSEETIKMHSGDMDNILRCSVPDIGVVSSYHFKLYEYLYSIGIEFIKIIPEDFDNRLDFSSAFSLMDWDGWESRDEVK